MMATTSYPGDFDYVWFAVDRSGYVAAFTTGGSGPIPTQLADIINKPTDSLEQSYNTMSRIASAQLLVRLNRMDDYVDFAERGIFAYDWYDVHRSGRDRSGMYELLASPSVPVNVEQLPKDFAAYVSNVKLESVAFQSTIKLDIRSATSCVESEHDSVPALKISDSKNPV